MPTTAEQLLSALAPLPFPARLALTARTARRLADDGHLTPLLADLDARGPYERRLAAAGLVTGAGVLLGWPEEWRSLLRLLRGHPHPYVRHEAYRTMTESE